MPQGNILSYMKMKWTSTFNRKIVQTGASKDSKSVLLPPGKTQNTTLPVASRRKQKKSRNFGGLGKELKII